MADGGLMSKEISDKLFISIHTVNRHRQNILEKMNVENLSAAISYAKKLGLLA
jgi:DNA-binding NarL/FixJ family response regulator